MVGDFIVLGNGIIREVRSGTHSSAWKYLTLIVAILASRRNTPGNRYSRLQRPVDGEELLPGPDGNWNG